MATSAKNHAANRQTSSDTSLAGFEVVLIGIVIAGMATNAGVFCLGFVPYLFP
jgi:hypothetical protein